MPCNNQCHSFGTHNWISGRRSITSFQYPSAMPLQYQRYQEYHHKGLQKWSTAHTTILLELRLITTNTKPTRTAKGEPSDWLSWIYENEHTATATAILLLLLLLLLLLHQFNGLFFRTTWVSQYQKGKTSLDFNEARDDGVLGCSGISWTIYKQSARSRQITTPTPHQSQFLQAWCFFWRPTNSFEGIKVFMKSNGNELETQSTSTVTATED